MQWTIKNREVWYQQACRDSRYNSVIFCFICFLQKIWKNQELVVFLSQGPSTGGESCEACLDMEQGMVCLNPHNQDELCPIFVFSLRVVLAHSI